MDQGELVSPGVHLQDADCRGLARSKGDGANPATRQHPAARGWGVGRVWMASAKGGGDARVAVQMAGGPSEGSEV